MQLAVEGRPAEALSICEPIDRSELAALPAMILAWGHTIALGDLGNHLKAAAVAEEAASTLAAASPEVAYYQAVILVVYHTRALINGRVRP